MKQIVCTNYSMLWENHLRKEKEIFKRKKKREDTRENHAELHQALSSAASNMFYYHICDVKYYQSTNVDILSILWDNKEK